MKIKTKLFLILGIVPIFAMFILEFLWFRISYISEIGTSLQQNYQTTALAEQIHQELNHKAIIVRNLVIIDNKKAIQKEMTRLQSLSNTITKDIDLLEASTVSTKQKEMVEDLKQINNEYGDFKDKFVKLVSTGKRQEAIRLMNKTEFPIHTKLMDTTSTVTNNFAANMKASFRNMSGNFQIQIVIAGIISLILICLFWVLIFRFVLKITKRINIFTATLSGITDGSADLSTRIIAGENDEFGRIVNLFNKMVESLEKQMKREQSRNWIKAHIADISSSLTGMHDLKLLSQTFLSKIAPLMESCQAAFYVKDPDEQSESIFRLLASYAFTERKHPNNTVRPGEGLVGQAVLEKSSIILTDVPHECIHVHSGLGEAAPLTFYFLPVIFEDDVKAVLELASFKPFNQTQQTFLEEIINSLGIILDSVMGRIQLAKLLEESRNLLEEVQAQSEELQSQHDKLKATNEELEENAKVLLDYDAKLQIQQEELEQKNKELEEKANLLQEQNKKYERMNQELERARAGLEEQAQQLTLSSKYKSEFLANVSHELRTPLNSLLILSKLLFDNSDGNLTDKQVQFAKTIYSSGRDLLALINDLLDLTKIEAGKMEVNPSEVRINNLINYLENRFRPVANQKNLQFSIVLQEGVPSFIYSDEQRLQQVLENLLANAFKFTENGEVSLVIDFSLQKDQRPIFSFSVVDTGIGISKEKQEIIFEAFQQADGTTSRKYGGTGLGLSICREIANLLGGKLVVESLEGKGSKFTFYIGDYQGEDHSVSVTNYHEVAVTLDCENTGEEVMTQNHKEIFDVKQLIKVNNIKKLLIAEIDLKQRNSLIELIGDEDIIIKAVSSGNEAMEELKGDHYDCLILDLFLSDMSGFELLEKIKQTIAEQNLKVIVYTERNLSSEEEDYLQKYAYTVIIKDQQAPQYLKDELGLHLKSSNGKREMSDQAEAGKIQRLPEFEGKRVLLVDDDVRNVYALSNILELSGLKVTFAENRKEGIELLKSNLDFDIVLMDIMMPEMDGYEAMQKIRDIPKFRDIPIIALTAKAMKEDREKCIAAGASDYVVKPVESDQLISLMRVWLYKQKENI